MIIFDLRCAPAGHVFEAWFGSGEDYAAQKVRGLVACPLCGSQQIDKAPMAPAVGAKGNRTDDLPPARLKAMLGALAEAQTKMLESSEHVGQHFATEARAIHLGEADARAIHGKATRAEAEQLADEGIKVAPLPFPVAEPGEEN